MSSSNPDFFDTFVSMKEQVNNKEDIPKLLGIPLYSSPSVLSGKSIQKYIIYIACIFLCWYFIDIVGIFNDSANNNIYAPSNSPFSGRADYFISFWVDLFNFIHLPQYIGNFIFGIIFLIIVCLFFAPIIGMIFTMLLIIFLNIKGIYSYYKSLFLSNWILLFYILGIIFISNLTHLLVLFFILPILLLWKKPNR